MRKKVVENILDKLNYPYNDSCVSFITETWEQDHMEQINEPETDIEIDEEDVKIYWFSYVKKMFNYDVKPLDEMNFSFSK